MKSKFAELRHPLSVFQASDLCLQVEVVNADVLNPVRVQLTHFARLQVLCLFYLLGFLPRNAHRLSLLLNSLLGGRVGQVEANLLVKTQLEGVCRHVHLVVHLRPLLLLFLLQRVDLN